MNSQSLNNVSMLAGRAMLATIFIVAGIGKIGAYAGTQGYMESFGLPGMLLPAVIALEIGGGIAILVGFQTRIAAALLAGFTLLAAVIFHSDFSQQMQSILFMKNVAIAGAFKGPSEPFRTAEVWLHDSIAAIGEVLRHPIIIEPVIGCWAAMRQHNGRIRLWSGRVIVRWEGENSLYFQ